MSTRKKFVSLTLLLIVTLVGALWSYVRWRHNQVHIATDNAYIRSNIYMVASKVPGNLLTVEISENAKVEKGATVATLDPRDFEMAVAKADAGLAEAEAQLATDRALISQAQAEVDAARSQLSLALLDQERTEALFRRQSIPKQRLDQAVSQKGTWEARVESGQRSVAAARSKLAVDERKVGTARTAIENARLQRTYCTIVSPVSGIVSRKSAEPGQVVAPGQPLCAVVPLATSDIWIEANFKETQLRNVKPGQRVVFKTDLDPSKTYTGKVDSISAGTGAAFSLLPPENATGNWVKIVQRVPVKITIDPGADPEGKLRVGLTVSVEIQTAEFHLFGS